MEPLAAGLRVKPTSALLSGDVASALLSRPYPPGNSLGRPPRRSGSPLVAGDVEVDAQRPPHVAGLDTFLDRLGGGPALETGQRMVRQNRRPVGGAEPQHDPFVELR